MRVCFFKTLITSLFLYSFISIFDNPALAEEDYYDTLQMQLIMASPGDVIEIPKGEFVMKGQLSLTVPDVTIRGQGMGQSVLAFKEQASGAEGLLIASSGVTLENFTISDTVGDGVKLTNAENLIVRSVKVIWHDDLNRPSGAYGIYPVLTRNVLVEHCLVEGASDAGIYVGQSENAIIRYNIAQKNVAGIEVENSSKVDVYSNQSSHNTIGLIAFNLPNLSRIGSKVRLFDNVITNNNTPNFAHKGNYIQSAPSGTGIMITAIKEVELFNNLIANNSTANLLISSFLLTEDEPITDDRFDPFPQMIHVHDNKMFLAGYAPRGGVNPDTDIIIEVLKDAVGLPLPDLIFDGFKKASSQQDTKICIHDNNNLRFVDFGIWQKKLPNPNLEPFNCSLKPLGAVSF